MAQGKGLSKTGKKMLIRAAVMIVVARKLKQKAMKLKLKRVVRRAVRRKRR